MPAFSQARLKRRKAASKYSFSRTRTLGIQTSKNLGQEQAALRLRRSGGRILMGAPQKGKNMRVLGIESSCDETAVAVYDEAKGLLSHRLHSQVAMHQAYGGVVPELASRDHVRRLLPLVREPLQAAQSDAASIDGI